MKTWLVRAGKHGEDESTALDRNLVIIGWNEYPDFSKVNSRDELHELHTQIEPDKPKGYISNAVGQMNAFLFKMQKGDIVALPLKSKPQIALGYVEGPYKYSNINGKMRHTRAVKWIRTDVPRTQFGQDLLYSLGAFMTVCQIKRNNAAQRILKILEGNSDPSWIPPDNIADTDEENVSFDIEQIAQDQIIAHMQKNFKGHELARLVCVVLEAEGYTTFLSPPGPDRGIDILAAQGTLGFEPPRLCVQVKSSESTLGATVLRELLGTMSNINADQGLLVSWGGFKHTTEKEARNAFFKVRLWDSEDIMNAVFKNYSKLPEEIQTALPLKKIWMLVSEEDDE